MKKITLALISMVLATPLFAQTTANYETALNKFQAFYNHQQTDSIFNMLSDKVKTLMPLDKTTQAMNKLYSQCGEMKSYELTRRDEPFNYYKATFANAKLTILASLDKENKLETFRFLPYNPDAPAAKKEKSNIVLKTATGDIYGTLVTPNGDRKVPVALIIAGSGPTDRDGNNDYGVRSNTYLMLADSLQKAGIATVRYDKRGIGESRSAVKEENGLVFDDMVNDAAGFIKLLKDDSRFSKVFVLGHSEGSLIGMLAADKEKVSGFISVAGAGENIGNIIGKQERAQSKEAGDEAKIIVDSLKQGYDVKNISDQMMGLFRPSIQPYMKSFLKYEPADEIKKLRTPILIVQGTHDMQVDVSEARQLQQAAPAASLNIINGMNHVLKQAPEDRKGNAATYSDPNLPLSQGLTGSIVRFIKS